MEKILLDHGFFIRENKWRFVETLYAFDIRGAEYLLTPCQIQIADIGDDEQKVWGLYVNGVYVIDIETEEQLISILKGFKIA